MACLFMQAPKEPQDWERKYYAIQELCADSLSNQVKGLLHRANNTPQIRQELRQSSEQRRIEQQRQADMQLWQQMKQEQHDKEMKLFRMQQELVKPLPKPEPHEPCAHCGRSFVADMLASMTTDSDAAAPLGEIPPVDSVDPTVSASAPGS